MQILTAQLHKALSSMFQSLPEHGVHFFVLTYCTWRWMLLSWDIKHTQVRQEAAKTMVEGQDEKKTSLLTPSCFLLLSGLEIYWRWFGVDFTVYLQNCVWRKGSNQRVCFIVQCWLPLFHPPSFPQWVRETFSCLVPWNLLGGAKVLLRQPCGCVRT